MSRLRHALHGVPSLFRIERFWTAVACVPQNNVIGEWVARTLTIPLVHESLDAFSLRFVYRLQLLLDIPLRLCRSKARGSFAQKLVQSLQVVAGREQSLQAVARREGESMLFPFGVLSHDC